MANNTIEHLPKESYYAVQVEASKVAGYMLYLIKHAMVYYFTDRAPMLTEFKDWVVEEIVAKRGWAIDQVKFARRNFFLIVFSKEAHRDAALDIAPGTWIVNLCALFHGNMHLACKDITTCYLSG